MEDKIRSIAKELLTDNKVSLIIGYGQIGEHETEPVFISKPEDTDKLVWNKYCYNNLAVFLTKEMCKGEGKTGVIVKGCDAKAITGLIQEHKVNREDIEIIAVECSGVGDPLMKKCSVCSVHKPGVSDHLISSDSPLPENVTPEDFADVIEFEKKSDSEKMEFWKEQFSKCIKCYACRSICPMCYCNRCIAIKNQPQIVPSSADGWGNFFWNFVRGFHLAGRCIGCGECERACPAGIPLGLINKKAAMIVKENFDYIAGSDSETAPPFTDFRKDDKEDFIL
jgi:ferredoxin